MPFVSFLLVFPKRKKALSQNALGKSQKEEDKKQKEKEKNEEKNEEKKDKKEDGKKEKTKEIEADDHSGKDLITNI